MNKAMIITALLFSIHSSYAQINVHPPVQQIVMNQDKTQGFFSVKNLSQQMVTVKIEAEDWPNRPEKPVYSWTQWLMLPDTMISLKPGESREINYLICLPNDMEQEAVAMVYFTPQQQQQGIKVQSRYGCALYAHKKGTENYQAEIEKITVQISPQGDYYADIIINNKGNIHLLPKAYLIINKAQQRIAYLPLYIKKPLYVHEKKTYTITWVNQEMQGTYHGKLILCFGPDLRIEKKFTFKINEKRLIQNL